jgi:hypothetical protein
MALKIFKNVTGMHLPIIVLAAALAGCWVAPRSDVQPKGEARMIQEDIPVVSVKEDAKVQSIDTGQGVIVLKLADGLTATAKSAPDLKNFSKVRAGDTVKATVAQELNVYVLINGEVPGLDGKPVAMRTDARVLEIDPAYRLLTLEYANKSVEVLKVPLGTKLSRMEAGNSVRIETKELRAIKVQKP